MACIYKITNTVTGQIYVGKTKQTIQTRWKKHVYDSARLDTFLYRAMRKYGIEAFTIQLVETVQEADLDQRECDWIQQLVTMAPTGYNLTEGGTGGDTSQSPNYQRAMLLRDTRGDRNSNYGKRGQHSPNYGKVRSVEQRDRMRVGVQQAWDADPDRKQKARERIAGLNNPMYGKKPTTAMKVVFDGQVFYSLADAIRATHRSSAYIKKHGTITYAKQTSTLV